MAFLIIGTPFLYTLDLWKLIFNNVAIAETK